MYIPGRHTGLGDNNNDDDDNNNNNNNNTDFCNTRRDSNRRK